MLLPTLNRQLREAERPRINRAPSPLIALSVPWLVVMLGSMLPTWPLISSAPVLPPLGFFFLIGWQQMRPGLFPVWAGLPLGLIDDLFSGQPFGSAVLLWSAAMIVLEAVEYRFPWRGFFQNWLVACGLIAAYLVLALVLANIAGGGSELRIIAPQLIVSLLVYPAATRVVWLFERLRLLPLWAVQ